MYKYIREWYIVPEGSSAIITEESKHEIIPLFNTCVKLTEMR